MEPCSLAANRHSHQEERGVSRNCRHSRQRGGGSLAGAETSAGRSILTSLSSLTHISCWHSAWAGPTARQRALGPVGVVQMGQPAARSKWRRVESRPEAANGNSTGRSWSLWIDSKTEDDNNYLAKVSSEGNRAIYVNCLK